LGYPVLVWNEVIERYFYQDIMKLGEVIQQIDINKLVLGIFGVGGLMIGVALGIDEPTPAIIGIVLLIIGVRIKIHMG
jgi:hypothetical protein